MEIVSPGCKLLKTVGLSAVRPVFTKLRLKNRQKYGFFCLKNYYGSADQFCQESSFIVKS